jgi:hypothetical protein
MTQEDADRLRVWIAGLTVEQFGLFWRWVTIAYFNRLRQGDRKHGDTEHKLYEDRQ